MLHFDTPMFFLLIPVLILLMAYLKIRDNNRRKSLIGFPQYMLLDNIKNGISHKEDTVFI